MVEHELCLLTSALSHIGHAENIGIGEDRSVFTVTVNHEVDLHRAGTSQ